MEHREESEGVGKVRDPKSDEIYNWKRNGTGESKTKEIGIKFCFCFLIFRCCITTA